MTGGVFNGEMAMMRCSVRVFTLAAVMPVTFACTARDSSLQDEEVLLTPDTTTVYRLGGSDGAGWQGRRRSR